MDIRKKEISALEPYQLGYIFKGWAIKGTTTKLEDEAAIWSAISAKKNATLVPIFEEVKEADIVNYTVTYSVDGSITEMETEIKAMGTHMTLMAEPEDENAVFQYWVSVDDKGNESILSYSESYTFLVTQDITIKAVYGEAEATVKPTIGITGQYEIKNGDDVVKVAFAATRDIPEGYTLVEHGMLYTRDNTDEATFVDGVEGVYKYTANKTQAQGTLTVNVLINGAASQATENIKAKAYVIVKNTTTGEYETYYSDVAVYEIAKQGEN